MNPSSTNSLTTGTWVGIVVGAVAVLALLFLAVWLIWRRRRRVRSQAAASVQQYPLEKRPDAGLQDQRQEDLHDVYSRRHEMEDNRRQELWGGSFSPKEMQAREVAELEGSAR
jgi:FtsZ-interacting cell division protein ZipA